MSVAIKITQNIKDKNAKYSHSWIDNATAGDIVKRNSYPNKFHKTEPVSGGYRSRMDLHFEDNWRPFQHTAFDRYTEKEDKSNIVKKPDDAPIEDVTHYTYEIVALTQQEIDDYLAQDDDNLAHEQRGVHISEGEDLFEKCFNKIWKRHHKQRDAVNKLTKSEARDLLKWFAPVFVWLKLGNWHQAKREINTVITDNQVDLDAVAGMINTAEWLQTKILDYFDNEYDL
jgi:hypothetical protein